MSKKLIEMSKVEVVKLAVELLSTKIYNNQSKLIMWGKQSIHGLSLIINNITILLVHKNNNILHHILEFGKNLVTGVAFVTPHQWLNDIGLMLQSHTLFTFCEI